VSTVESDWIIVGRFCRPHGIKGSIAVLSFTEPRENILQYNDWHVQKKEQWIPITRISDEITHKHLLTRIKGYPEREDVASLTNLDIAVRREELPDLAPGEHYWHELMGMTVVHQDGTVFGTVTEIMETGSNDVFVVEGEHRYLIPYLPDTVVLQIDVVKRQITVNWDLDF
jgi:16S rRNA processing protein RimM